MAIEVTLGIAVNLYRRVNITGSKQKMVKENRAGAVAVILHYAHFWGHEGMSNIKGEFNFFFYQ